MGDGVYVCSGLAHTKITSRVTRDAYGSAVNVILPYWALSWPNTDRYLLETWCSNREYRQRYVAVSREDLGH